MRVKKSKDGETEITGSIATSAQLGKLGLYVEEQLRRMVRELASGNIDADPWARSEQDSACTYCEFAPACHFENGCGGDRIEYIRATGAEQLWEHVDRTIGEGENAMADILTAEQQAAVENRGRSLLVSAAAGSGKTKVLVERLFSYVESGEANLDDFLIITYTRAAAAELRGKIAKVLGEKLQEDPLNAHLQRQLLRVYRADIKTVDAFCTALLRENCHLLREDARGHALRPDFRVLDENEAQLLRERVLARTLDEFYETMRDGDGASLLADTLGAGRDDRALGALVLELHGKLQAQPYMDRWLASQAQLWHDLPPRVEDTDYGTLLLSMVRRRRSTVPALLRGAAEEMTSDAAPLRISMRRSFSAWRSNSRSSPCQRRRTGMRRRSAAWTFRA